METKITEVPNFSVVVTAILIGVCIIILIMILCREIRDEKDALKKEKEIRNMLANSIFRVFLSNSFVFIDKDGKELPALKGYQYCLRDLHLHSHLQCNAVMVEFDGIEYSYDNTGKNAKIFFKPVNNVLLSHPFLVKEIRGNTIEAENYSLGTIEFSADNTRHIKINDWISVYQRVEQRPNQIYEIFLVIK